MIYLDNAATSFPKPAETIEYLNEFVRNVGGNPGRSGHRLSLEAARVIFEARERLTAFIGMSDSERLIFTQNGTESLNMAILGLLKENDHVVTTTMEHNSVMRPLEFLSRERGVVYTAVSCSPQGFLDIDDLQRALKVNTRAVIINHGSNVTGAVQSSLDSVKDAIGEALLIVDACQTMGSIPIDMEKMKADILCFSGHKSLFSIQGVGALYVRPGIELTPLKFGGTGSKSESIEHPLFLPDRYECGTPNTPGIASLLGGLTFISSEGLQKIIGKKQVLRRMLAQGLRAVEGVIVYGHEEQGGTYLPVLAFNIRGKLPSEVGYELNKRSMYVRVGLHCSPVAHQTIGTFPTGTLRASPGYFTGEDEIITFLGAVREIAEG